MRYRLRERSITKPLDELERRRELFDNLPIDPTHAEWMRRRAWVRTVHGTARIEGNTASDVEVEALLEGEGKTRISDREAREIIGTRDALTLADELAVSGTLPDEAVIRGLHRRVLWNQSPLLTPGEYRRGENRVEDADGTRIFRTPPSGDVPELMRQLGAWLTTTAEQLAPPVAAALAHLEFVAIHPFNDGNGRTARALARLILVQHGYALDGLVSLDAHLDLDRRAYFSAIRDAIGRDYEPGYDATPFVRYFVSSITSSADFVLARLRGLGEVMIEDPPSDRRRLAAAVDDRRARVRVGEPPHPCRRLHPPHGTYAPERHSRPRWGRGRWLAAGYRREARPILRPRPEAPRDPRARRGHLAGLVTAALRMRRPGSRVRQALMEPQRTLLLLDSERKTVADHSYRVEAEIGSVLASERVWTKTSWPGRSKAIRTHSSR